MKCHRTVCQNDSGTKKFCSAACAMEHRHWRSRPRGGRTCQFCHSVLVQREGENNYTFKRRTHCGHACANRSGARSGFVVERMLLVLVVVALIAVILSCL